MEYNFKQYKKVDIQDKKFVNGFSIYFQECSKNFSNYLDNYFIRKDGVLDGFRRINA